MLHTAAFGQLEIVKKRTLVLDYMCPGLFGTVAFFEVLHTTYKSTMI